MDNDWKSRLGMVYSTNKDADFSSDEDMEDALENNQQDLRVQLDRKKRKGKAVTLVTGYLGHPDDLKELAKTLKQKCGVGGSTKDGEIIIQGDFVQKVIEILKNNGYKVKRIGG